jgi:hypothetical protein
MSLIYNSKLELLALVGGRDKNLALNNNQSSWCFEVGKTTV